MPDPVTTPAGVAAGQPAGGTPAPAAEETKQAQGEDERIGLRARAIAAEREAATLKEQAKKSEEAKLTEQGEHQELAKLKEAEANDWKAKYSQAQRSNALIAAGARAGIRDAEDLALAKLGDVDVGDASALREAAEKAVADLTKSKPYLFGSANGKSGTPFNTPAATPGGPAAVRLDGPVRNSDVHALSREQKQLLVKQTNGDAVAAGGGFFQKG